MTKGTVPEVWPDAGVMSTILETLKKAEREWILFYWASWWGL